MIDFANALLTPLYTVFYEIFIQGGLIFLDFLYQIFTFLTGSTLTDSVFGVAKMDNGNISFIFDWSSDIAKYFYIPVLVLALISLIFFISAAFLSDIYGNSKQRNSADQLVSGWGKMKWVVYFCASIIFVPVFFLILNMLVSMFALIIQPGSSNILTPENIKYYKTELIPNLDLLKGIGANINLNTDTGSESLRDALDTIDSSINSFMKSASAVGNSDIADICNNIESQINNIKYMLDGNNSDSVIVAINNIEAIINNLSPDKVIDTDSAEIIKNNLDIFNNFNLSFINLNDNLKDLVNHQSTIIGYDPSFKGQFVLIDSFIKSAGSIDKTEIGYFVSTCQNQSLIYNLSNSNGENLSLYNLSNILSNHKDFSYVLSIYRIIANDPNATNWKDIPVSELKASNLLIGLVFLVMAIILMLFFCLFVTKRVFYLAIYFIVSVIIFASAIQDDGLRVSLWFKVVIGKFLSILIITLGFNLGLTLASGFNSIINNIPDHDHLWKSITSCIVDFSGLLAAYGSTISLGKMIGDDSSMAEGFADMAIIRTGFSLGVKPAMGLTVASGQLATGNVAGATGTLGKTIGLNVGGGHGSKKGGHGGQNVNHANPPKAANNVSKADVGNAIRSN